MTENERNLPAVQAVGLAVVAGVNLTPGQRDLVKRTVARGATDDELNLFLSIAASAQLNPFTDEIYFTKFHNRRTNKDEVVIMPGIDGLRRKAAESGDYEAQVGPFWCGEDGVWKDVWFSQEMPAAAKVGIIRKGASQPTWAVVKWSEFNRQGAPGSEAFWGKRPVHMIAIVAERHALRKACPGIDQMLRQQGVDTNRDAELLMARIERLERSETLPDMDRSEEPFGDETIEGEVTHLNGGSDETDEVDLGASEEQQETEPQPWSDADRRKFRAHTQKSGLTNTETVKLLGLQEGAVWADVTGLGGVDEVIRRFDASLEEAVANHGGGQEELL